MVKKTYSKKMIKSCLSSYLPVYAIAPLLFTLLWNSTVYSGARLIAGNWHHYDMTTSLDRMIPVIPCTTIIYFGCFLFWGINYILSVSSSKEAAWKFLAADFLAKAICLIFYILLPTTNVRPDIPDTGFWNRVLLILYQIDSPDNLFPSIHCLVSWLCWRGIKDNSRISLWYRRWSLIFAILVFISTLTTWQHVIADVISGVVVAEIGLYISNHTRFSLLYGRFMEFINTRTSYLIKKGKSLE